MPAEQPHQQLTNALPRRWRGLFGTGLVGLIGVQFALWSPALTALAFAAPLLLCAWFVGRGSLRAYGASALCSLPYFIHGLTDAVASPPTRLWATLESGCCVALYLGLIGIASALRRARRR